MNTENEKMYNALYNKIFISAKKGSAKNIMHKFLEKKLSSHYPDVLEIGTNNLEHYDFLKHSFDRYLATDIRLSSNLDLNTLPNKVEFKVADVCNLESFNNDSFDRVLSTCVIQHVLNPEAAFREMFRVTKIGGRIDILIQNDIGPLFKLIRKWTTLRNAKKYDLLNEVELFLRESIGTI